MTTIKFGSRGADVITLQKKINVYPDGIFGKLTLEAVKEFQQKHGLTVDGIVGAKTWAALGDPGGKGFHGRTNPAMAPRPKIFRHRLSLCDLSRRKRSCRAQRIDFRCALYRTQHDFNRRVLHRRLCRRRQNAQRYTNPGAKTFVGIVIENPQREIPQRNDSRTSRFRKQSVSFV